LRASAPQAPGRPRGRAASSLRRLAQNSKPPLTVFSTPVTCTVAAVSQAAASGGQRVMDWRVRGDALLVEGPRRRWSASDRRSAKRPATRLKL